MPLWRRAIRRHRFQFSDLQDCGSILPQFLAEYQLYWIPVGLLDSDPGIPLKQHIHVDSKAEWEILDADTRQFGEGFGSA